MKWKDKDEQNGKTVKDKDEALMEGKDHKIR